MTMNRRTAMTGWIAVSLSLLALSAGAQDAWPSKPVRMVVPFAPGGSTDVIARMVGQKL